MSDRCAQLEAALRLIADDIHLVLDDHFSGLPEHLNAAMPAYARLAQIVEADDGECSVRSVDGMLAHLREVEADPPPTRLDRRTRETLEAAGRALNEAERTLRLRLVYGPGLTTSLRDAHRQIVHLLAEDEGEPDRPVPEIYESEHELLALLVDADARADALAQRLAVVEEAARYARDCLISPEYKVNGRLDAYDVPMMSRAMRKLDAALATAEVVSPTADALAEDEGEPPVVLTIREEARCTGYCIFDGDALTHPDLSCPIHGSEAQAKAKTAGLDRVEWMQACRASWPFAPAIVPGEKPR